MQKLFQNRFLTLVLAIGLLISGSMFSSTSLSSNENLDICKITSGNTEQCSPSDTHGDSDSNTNHCQSHCGHCVTATLTMLRQLSHNIEVRKVLARSEDTPRNAVIEPGLRPPSL